MSVPVGGYALGRKHFVDQEKRRLSAAHPSWSKPRLARTALDAWWDLTHDQRRRVNLQHSGTGYSALKTQPGSKWTGWKVYCSEERIEEHRTALPGHAGLTRRGLPHNKLVAGVSRQWKALSAAEKTKFERRATLLNKQHGFLPNPVSRTPEQLMDKPPARPPLDQADIDRHVTMLGGAGDGCEWRFKTVFVQYSSTRISLYLAVDTASGQIRDRALVKEGINGATVHQREFEIHRRLYKAATAAGTTASPGREPIVEIFRTANDRAHGSSSSTTAAGAPEDVEIALEYCAYGDANYVVAMHKFTDRLLPEPFLWTVFDSLARACVLLETGALPSTTDPSVDADTRRRAPHWAGTRQVVHTDIKPSNVFLRAAAPPPTTAAAGWTSAYPAACVGDFGLSHWTHAGDARNRRTFMHQGTAGFFGPENASSAVDSGHQVLAPYNVWQAGKTMWCLLARVTENDVPDTAFDPHPVTGGLPGLPGGGPYAFGGHPRGTLFPERMEVEDAYSRRLVDLVYACLDVFPEMRVGAPELLRETGRALRDVGKELPRREGEEGVLDVPPLAYSANPWPNGQGFEV